MEKVSSFIQKLNELLSFEFKKNSSLFKEAVESCLSLVLNFKLDLEKSTGVDYLKLIPMLVPVISAVLINVSGAPKVVVF